MSSEQSPSLRVHAVMDHLAVPGATAQRLRADRLSMVKPEGHAAAAFESAKLRLLAMSDGLPVAELAWCGLAALAIGEWGMAARTVQTLRVRNDQSARSSALSLELMLLAAQCAWTGDVAAGYQMLPRARRVLAQLLGGNRATQTPSATTPEDAALCFAALRDMAIAAETVGDTALAAELRAHAGQQRAMLQNAAAGASALAVALGTVAGAPFESQPVPYLRTTPFELGFAAWAEAAASRVDDAWRTWMVLVEHVHDTAPTSANPDVAGAYLILSFTFGLLGVAPDAVRNRLRLSPRVPADQNALEITHLRLGDASVRFAMDRDDLCCRFCVEQLEGATPVRLIFEPVLPAAGIRAARVDTQPALLDVRSLGRYCCAPVQLLLDAERSIEFELAE